MRGHTEKKATGTCSILLGPQPFQSEHKAHFPQSFRCLCAAMDWNVRRWKKETENKEEKWGIPPTLWVLGHSFPLLEPQLEGFSLFCLHPNAYLWGLNCLVSGIRDTGREKTMSSLLLWCTSNSAILSQSTCHCLLFSPQIIAPYYAALGPHCAASCIHWERQSEVCSLHRIWNQNWTLLLGYILGVRQFTIWGRSFICRNTGIARCHLNKGIWEKDGRSCASSSLTPCFHICCPVMLATCPEQMRWESDLISHCLRPSRDFPHREEKMNS